MRNTAAALAAVAASAYFAYDFRWQQGIVELEEEAASRLDVASAAVFAPTQKFGYLPELLADHPVVVNALRHPQDRQRAREASRYLERVNASAQAAVVYLIDGEGRTIAASNADAVDSFIGRNYAFRPYFQNAIANGKATFYGIGATSLLPGYYVAQAVREGGRTLGVAVVKVDMTQLDQEWQRNEDEVAVTDDNGIIFLSTRPDWKYRPMVSLHAEALDEIKRSRQYGTMLKPPLPMRTVRTLHGNEAVVSIVGDGGNGVRFFVRSRPVEGSGWNISVFIPLSEVEARAWRVAFSTSGAIGLILMTLMMLAQAHARAEERESARQALEKKHSELQALSEELRAASITDPLTGAYNRRFFFESVPKIVSTANRHHVPLSIVTIDVDHFKRINDMYGHPAGDKVLQALTVLCKESLRESDVFCRFGGEEFIMALPNTDAEAAAQVAERLRVRVSAHAVEIKGMPGGITVSCGVSQYREGEQGIEAALRRADDALYVAKNEGRNRVVVR
ncbi:hypothetical protein AYR66_26110 [Noviherbaspirillum denitrificans]|uniref:diguanylate cyclase n=2 Tax=Noviherbaspirillum denitrificans TaxID=1968433 RepID=A0A254TIY1_9BURK|nr:hypothetical protein AYR66_26110 [Noviherbaspirillum denitrificans]